MNEQQRREYEMNGKLHDALTEAHELAAKWEAQGVIVTIERRAREPLEMGNHAPRVEVRPKRGHE